jgi:hypothetical protein
MLVWAIETVCLRSVIHKLEHAAIALTVDLSPNLLKTISSPRYLQDCITYAIGKEIHE